MTGVALRRCRRGSLLRLFLCHQFATESVERRGKTGPVARLGQSTSQDWANRSNTGQFNCRALGHISLLRASHIRDRLLPICAKAGAPNDAIRRVAGRYGHGLATADLDFELPWKDASMDEQQMDMDGEDKIALRRRSFLRLLAAGGSAAAAPAAPLGGHAVADTLSYDERRGPLYRETEEVKNFYRVNRYPTPGRR